MKKISFILYLALLLFFQSCDEESYSYIDSQNSFFANFDFSTDTVTAPGTVQLINRSKSALSYNWTFSGAEILSDGVTLDIETSTDLSPDTLFYELPGSYPVSLTASNGELTDSLSKTLVVVKMSPQIIAPENIGVGQDITFTAKVFQYPGVPVSYLWTFEENGTSTEASPTISYANAGEYTVTLTINDGEESLSTSTSIEVQGELTKSLYFTDMQTGKLLKYAFKQVADPEITSYDVEIGTHPLAMQISGNKIYIADAGDNLTYSSSSADGRIFSVDMEGDNDVTIGLGSGTYAQDPFNLAIDSASNTIYYITRNNNVRSIDMSSVEATLPTSQIFGITASNAGVSSVWGWIDGGIQIVGDEIWYSKHGASSLSAIGRGLYKFSKSSYSFIENISALSEYSIRNFIVDESNDKIYFVVNNEYGGLSVGLYQCALDGSDIVLIDDLDGFSQEGRGSAGTGAEFAAITSLTLDTSPDDGSAGYLYYAYRSENDIDNLGNVIGTGDESGIKMYPLDGSAAPSFLVTGYIPYGLAIDNIKR